MIACRRCDKIVNETAFKLLPITERTDNLHIQFVCPSCGTVGEGIISPAIVRSDGDGKRALRGHRIPYITADVLTSR